MLLLLVRHATAAEHDSVKYPDDALRPLVKKGRETHAGVSRLLRKRKLVPDAILSSPFKRAWQTAQIMSREFAGKTKKKIKPRPAPSLAREPDLDALRQDFEGLDEARIVALVGHEPWLSTLASILLTGEPHRLVIDYPKSGVLGIETGGPQSGSGMLRFFLRPKLL
ncbi:MAG: histidine phosphatase family protein [Gemmatimonadales bacterium]